MSLDAVLVREAGAGDLGGVLALERDVAEAPHWAEGAYRKIVLEGGVRRCLFVAEAEGLLLGFAVGAVTGDSAELESVAMRGEARRRGVGSMLCDAVAEWCRLQGATALELEVRAASAGAMALYEGLGFVSVGRRLGYYREPVDDAVLMRLKLA
jgi:[ribosomal protein S18]-alanine N-acetyltransferase